MPRNDPEPRGQAAVIDLPALEREVAARWARSELAARSPAVAGPRWTCFVEPLTTAGLPGAAHLRVLALADLYPRFKAMQGFTVSVSHGWACHGLSVEISVARELGLASRAEVEDYGVEAFTARCRESALRHAGVFASLGERMGSFADPNLAYRTMDRGYVESVWWSLRQFFDAKMLFPDRRPAHYCSRCETTLADHELRGPGVYRPVKSTAVTARLRLDPLASSAQLSGAELLVWTPEPWTLTGNVAVAVHPDETYVIGRRAGHDVRVIVAERAFARVLGDGWHISSRLTGADLAGATYQPAFKLIEDGVYQVLADRSVHASRGTGLLPIAPAFDGEQGVSGELPAVDPLGADGRFDGRVPVLSGRPFTDADPAIIAYLSDRGLLFTARPRQVHRPHCWRCGTRLLRRLRSSWYLGLSGAAARLRVNYERVAWRPAGARPLGGGTASSADWAVSKTRYWGVPLPIWKCGLGHLTCVSSLTELSELAGRDLLGADPHRPVIDRIEIVCRICGGQARRVPDIIDSAYDAGAMPFAQHGAPMRHRADFDASGPAELLIAGGAQVRSWHYALLAIGSLVLGRTPVQAGLRCGDVLDSRGRPMTAQQGNLSAPFPLIDRHGADAVRWYFAASARPDAAVRVTDALIRGGTRGVLRRFLNCAMLFSRYAELAASGEPKADTAPGRSILDRWLLSVGQSTVAEVTAALDDYRPDTATRRIEQFIGDLSAWYVRRSRDRIAGHEGCGPQEAALATMRTALEVACRLMAPFAPYLSDHAWSLIRGCDSPDSVHLARWPQAQETPADDRLRRQMVLVRRIVRVGRAARAAAGIGLRQPLAVARVAVAGFSELGPELLELVADELNVKSIELLPAAAGFGSGCVIAGQPGLARGCLVALDVAVTPELRLEGLARQAIRVVQEARRAGRFRLGEQIAVGWQSPDPEVAAALTGFGLQISRRVRAAKYEAAIGGEADSFEYASNSLPATFWLSPLLSPLIAHWLLQRGAAGSAPGRPAGPARHGSQADQTRCRARLMGVSPGLRWPRRPTSHRLEGTCHSLRRLPYDYPGHKSRIPGKCSV
ncbi:MAG TPA: class I tRNA ligase family protein [Streptosporangiaceae bacterium]